MSDKTVRAPTQESAKHDAGANPSTDSEFPVNRRSLLVGSAGLAVGGMLGASTATAQSAETTSPANVPPPITRTQTATVRLEFETIEIEAHLDTNSTFRFWTFDGKVPGLLHRVRVGDTVEVYRKNN